MHDPTDNPIVAELEHALRLLGCEHTNQAAALLDAAPITSTQLGLTGRERTALLARFTETPVEHQLRAYVRLVADLEAAIVQYDGTTNATPNTHLRLILQKCRARLAGQGGAS